MHILEDYYDEENEHTYRIIEDKVITFRGQQMTQLSNVINYSRCGFDVEEPPLLDLANVCLYTTDPLLTLNMVGISPHYHRHTSQGLTLTNTNKDSCRVWYGLGYPNDNAKVGFGILGQVRFFRESNRTKERMMAVLGARLLEGPKGVEAAETARIRQNTEPVFLGLW